MLKFDTILGDRAERGFSAAPGVGTIDDFRVNAGPHGIEHIASSQIDGGRTIKIEINSQRAAPRRWHE